MPCYVIHAPYLRTLVRLNWLNLVLFNNYLIVLGRLVLLKFNLLGGETQMQLRLHPRQLQAQPKAQLLRRAFSPILNIRESWGPNIYSIYISCHTQPCQASAAEEALKAEKVRREELEQQVKMLQLQMSQASLAKSVTTPPPPPTSPDTSRLENLVTQALSRMENIEATFQKQATEAKPAEKTMEPEHTVASRAPSKSGRHALPEEPGDDSSMCSDDDGDDDEDETITTPDGKTVPLMLYVIYRFIYESCDVLPWGCVFSLFLWKSKVNITADALRMRCRRLCERKPSGKYNINQSVSEQYKEGGPAREMLEMALLECIGKHGLQRAAYKKIKADNCMLLMIYHRCLICDPSTYCINLARQSSPPNAASSKSAWSHVSQRNLASGTQNRQWRRAACSTTRPLKNHQLLPEVSWDMCQAGLLWAEQC